MQQQEQFGRDESDKKLEESRNWPRHWTLKRETEGLLSAA